MEKELIITNSIQGVELMQRSTDTEYYVDRVIKKYNKDRLGDKK